MVRLKIEKGEYLFKLEDILKQKNKVTYIN